MAIADLATPLIASAASPIAIRRTISENQICGLTWTNDDLPISLEKIDGETRRVATLEGIFDKRFSTLYANGQKVQVRPDGTFRTKIVLKRKSPTTLVFKAIDPKNEEDPETIELTYATHQNTPSDDSDPKNNRRPSSVMDYDWTWGFYKPQLTITPSLGYSTLIYQQTGINKLTETAITAKLSLYQPITPRIDFGANAFYTALPLTVEPGTLQPRFLGANLRFGYSPPLISDPYKLSIMVGGYMTMMSVPGDRFGYPLLLYPQFYPVLRRRIGSSSWLTFSFKYVPLSWIFDPSQYEISYGAAYTYEFKTGGNFSVSVDYSDLQFSQPDSTGQTIVMNLNTVTFGVGYGF
jgi:hypothetical protein